MRLRYWIYTFLTSIGLSTFPFQLHAETTYTKISKDQKVIADVV
jgi:hypothetical protein